MDLCVHKLYVLDGFDEAQNVEFGGMAAINIGGGGK